MKVKQTIQKLKYWLRCQWFEVVKAWNMSNGCDYLINLVSREIHDLNNTHSNCNLASIASRKFITADQLQSYLKYGFNGCRWCLKEHDTDMKR